MKTNLRLNTLDNVRIALTLLKKGEVVEGITLLDDIQRGHKFAIVDIPKGKDVIKYGYSIGRAKQDIKAGEHVHVHNLETNLNENLEYVYEKQPIMECGNSKMRQVNVYEREDGNIGIRNEIWIIPTVGCVNSQAKQIAQEFNNKYPDLEIDGVFVYGHPYGCSQLGDDHNRTRAILQSLVHHPNAGGCLVLGLGCENNQVSEFREGLKKYNPDRVKFLVAQEVEDEIEAGVKLLEEIYHNIKSDKRVAKDISCLKVGLKCGGSDGLSGITANPLLGLFSDYLVRMGGTTVLSEVPEMFGAEQILMARAKDRDVFDKIVKLINDFKDFYRKNGQVIYENPSPGNKAGGISTLEDKSLGCTQKGGHSEVVDVIFDGGEIVQKGLNLMNGPGNDMIAVTNLGAAGCHMVLFTTGRGTPFGGFVPTVKVSTNTELAEKKSNWIDFDAGQVLEKGFDAVLEEFIDFIAEVASGKRTCNEKTNSREIAIFKTGITL